MNIKTALDTAFNTSTQFHSFEKLSSLLDPSIIDEAFVDVKIGSLDDSARPELKRSTKPIVFSSTSNAVAAPATRPGSKTE